MGGHSLGGCSTGTELSLQQNLARFPTLLRKGKRVKKRLLENKVEDDISHLL